MTEGDQKWWMGREALAELAPKCLAVLTQRRDTGVGPASGPYEVMDG